MSKVVITVQGRARSEKAPEVATARVNVQFDGADRMDVMRRTTTAGEVLREEVKERETSGSVSKWSSDQLSVWSSRPWNEEGKQLGLVHHASLAFRVTFTDPAELSAWISHVSGLDGVRLNGITWDLTPESRAEIERETAARAVGEAVERATAYAIAIGRHTVTPVQIADTGLLQDTDTEFRAAPMMARGAAQSGEPEVELAPEPIVVVASVEAQFNAE